MRFHKSSQNTPFHHLSLSTVQRQVHGNKRTHISSMPLSGVSMLLSSHSSCYFIVLLLRFRLCSIRCLLSVIRWVFLLSTSHLQITENSNQQPLSTTVLLLTDNETAVITKLNTRVERKWEVFASEPSFLP